MRFFILGSFWCVFFALASFWRVFRTRLPPKVLQKSSAKSPKRAFRARLPPKAKRDQSKTQSHLHFTPSTRTISAEGCAPPIQNAISRPRRARSPQSVARDQSKTQSRLHFAPSPRTISAEGCPLSPAFRALDTHDLRRGLRATNPKRNLTCISRPRHARSPQRVARDQSKTQSHLDFALSTRSPQRGCPRPGQNAISPAFRAIDARDFRRG